MWCSAWAPKRTSSTVLQQGGMQTPRLHVPTLPFWHAIDAVVRGRVTRPRHTLLTSTPWVPTGTGTPTLHRHLDGTAQGGIWGPAGTHVCTALPCGLLHTGRSASHWPPRPRGGNGDTDASCDKIVVVIVVVAVVVAMAVVETGPRRGWRVSDTTW
jgi:hypothetical protein